MTEESQEVERATKRLKEASDKVEEARKALHRAQAEWERTSYAAFLAGNKLNDALRLRRAEA